MRCIRPLKAGQTPGGSQTYTNRLHSIEQVGFEFECRKCLPCRLNIAREKAVRAVHEARMHDDNIFLTLTYDDAHLTSPWLQYVDFQLFMKSLREKITRDVTDPELKAKLHISYMVTGEYGDKNKRPHWHAIIFNYRPKDQKEYYTTDLGETVYTSQEIDDLWKKGKTEYGSVTIESAGYVARYAAKKLSHGKDQDHKYHPIHKTSSKRAIGRAWIEKYHEHTFAHGFILLPNGQKSKIPRYYLDWAKKHAPEIWSHYVTQIRPKIIEESAAKNRQEEIYFLTQAASYTGTGHYPLTRSKVKQTILKSKFKQLQERLKL